MLSGEGGGSLPLVNPSFREMPAFRVIEKSKTARCARFARNQKYGVLNRLHRGERLPRGGRDSTDPLPCFQSLAGRNIEQISFRIAHLVLTVPAGLKQIHNHLVFGLDVGRLGGEIFRIVLGEVFNVLFERL